MVGTYAHGDEPVPGYRLVQPLGKGGFGEVWKAVGPGGVPAAIKIISLEAKQAHKELRAIQRVKFIRHPNLVPIAGLWLKDERGDLIDEQSLELAMAVRTSTLERSSVVAVAPSRELKEQRPAELVLAMGLGDKSLYDRLQECRKAGLAGIAPDELLDYMEAAARAIDYLNSPRHDLGFGPVAINHCDIKPQNMMIVGGAVQLCDFGLASVLGSQVGTGPIAVSPAYAAPELIQRLGPSPNTDQYSLAISYYELRTGWLPFDTDNFVKVVDAHLHGSLDLSCLPVSERLVIQRATALNPSERFRTSVEMVTGLRRALGIGPRTQAIGTAFEQESIEAPASAYASHDHSLVDTSTIRTTARVDDQRMSRTLVSRFGNRSCPDSVGV
jgi:serine/threonine protein kinase